MSELTESNEDKTDLTRAIMNILDGWGMSSAELVAVLDLPEKTPTRMLRRYRENTPFPDTPEVMQRLEHIVGIADALRTTYPHNPTMGGLWMKRKNSRFKDLAPIQLINKEGLSGILKVRTHLDCSFDWFTYEQPTD